MKKDHKKRVYENASELIGSPEEPTPLVRINRLFSGSALDAYMKLEWYNPFGSIKDRIARKMLEDARLEGKTVVEASSGNTGIALAALSNILGVPVEIAIPERAPEEKKMLLRLLGATLWQASDELCPLFPHEGARGLARSIHLSPEKKGKSVYTNQYENEKNVQAHYETTGPEIWKQTAGEVDYFVAGYGTTGTLCGVGKFLKEKKPSVKIIGVEPMDSKHTLPGMKNISKLNKEFLPTILDRSVIDETIGVSDADAYRVTMELARKEGMLVGPTTGAICWGALKLAERGEKGVAVLISPDNAFKYVSFFEPYLKDAGVPRI